MELIIKIFLFRFFNLLFKNSNNLCQNIRRKQNILCFENCKEILTKELTHTHTHYNFYTKNLDFLLGHWEEPPPSKKNLKIYIFYNLFCNIKYSFQKMNARLCSICK